MNVWFWIVLIGLLIVIWVFVLLPNFLDFLGYRIRKLRRFIDENESFFSIGFIVVFAIEQVILIILTHKYSENVDKLRLIISIFALIIITTASFQKLLLEIKRKYDKERYMYAKRASATIEKWLKDKK